MAAKPDDSTGGPQDPQGLSWPTKHDLFGVQVSATHYAQVVDLIVEAAERRQSMLVTFMPVHGLVTAATDASYRRVINDFDIVAPDGQPVRWALNRFHQAELDDRVYGPQTMLRVCRRAAEKGIGVYLYGSTDPVLDRLSERLTELCPGLRIVGREAPPFRPLTSDEQRQTIDRINASGAGVVMIGLGCPRQDFFAEQHRHDIHAVQMCVGAAFDFHAGNKKMAPEWMQKRGLEWLFRLTQEPSRLWRRYLFTNTIFILLCAKMTIQKFFTRRKTSHGHRSSATADSSVVC